MGFHDWPYRVTSWLTKSAASCINATWLCSTCLKVITSSLILQLDYNWTTTGLQLDCNLLQLVLVLRPSWSWAENTKRQEPPVVEMHLWYANFDIFLSLSPSLSLSLRLDKCAVPNMGCRQGAKVPREYVVHSVHMHYTSAFFGCAQDKVAIP